MSAFCKGCRKTKDNDEFGLKYDESQYKTCMKCRYKKKGVNVTFKSPECCDAEEIRNTFRKLNCEIVYFKELEYMLNLDTQIARHIFSGMFSHGNIAIVETITLYNLAPIVNFLQHIGFPMEDIRTYNLNLILYKDSNQTMNRAMDGSVINIFESYMKCLKLPNKKMCDICNNKKKCFRQCGGCKNKICVECFKNHNKDYIQPCPYCRYTIEKHGYRSVLEY